MSLDWKHPLALDTDEFKESRLLGLILADIGKLGLSNILD